jgi:8-oxo-dGTP diphosphatase
MRQYQDQKRILNAVDCIIFGYDGEEIKLLVIQRGFEPFKGKWSLVGGFIKENESIEDAASRILINLTGLDGVYMEQLHTFSEPQRDTVERTISTAYFALIDIKKYRQQLNNNYHPAWFPINQLPHLIFDHNEMVELAKKKLRDKASLYPLLFELLPDKFTIPQLKNLYECLYDTEFDKGNFSRKMLSSGLLVKQKDKERLTSKKGAFYYKLNLKKYNSNLHDVLNLVSKPDSLKSRKKN